MANTELLPPSVLKCKAVVYVRQSTQAQVQTNLESKHRQYEFVDAAKRRGFHRVEVIDDDLGRSASGTTARPGFERLVAALCAGEIGAVLCLDASRLARNGRDWHHLLELCGLVEARVIDLDGVYDPGRPNDRLLLGMKGSMSEFELGLLRTRMLDAARSKARRGELRISVPIGYVWHREIGLGFDPDLRVQEAILYLPGERCRTCENSLSRSEWSVPVRQKAGKGALCLANDADAGRHGGADADGTVPASGGAGMAPRRSSFTPDGGGVRGEKSMKSWGLAGLGS
ncbi:recombinase family protein [Azospirillum formosense]|uniref:recombinase family protein n=1 Tax=Azospirillum formosense TaxID=861533 RepID=UPI001FE60510|nr:recombinase family protein [Azospirillum formosense]